MSGAAQYCHPLTEETKIVFDREGDLPKVRVSLGRNRTEIQPPPAELFRLNQDILVTTYVPLRLDPRQLRKWPLGRLSHFHLAAKRARNSGQHSSVALKIQW